MREELLEILADLRPELNFEVETELVDDGVLDSFELASLVSEINDNFEVEISLEDVEPENFNSVDDMLRLIQKFQEEE